MSRLLSNKIYYVYDLLFFHANISWSMLRARLGTWLQRCVIGKVYLSTISIGSWPARLAASRLGIICAATRRA